MGKGEIIAGTATAFAAVAATLLVPVGLRIEAALVVACVGLWLTELLPPFAPTLVLLAVAPLVLQGPVPEAQRLVFGWAADPVLALFFGGFVMSAAARRHALDQAVARWIVLRSRGDARRLTLLLMTGTAALTMWMSNVAGPAMMLSATRPILTRLGNESPTRRRILVAVAMAANVAGMSTPLSAGPNGIAIAAIQSQVRVTFAGWMSFALPLVVGLLTLIYWAVRPAPGNLGLIDADPVPPLSRPAKGVVAVFVVTIGLWLSEPLHGVPASVVSLALAAALFATRLLHASDIARLEWSTLLLISGGILLGRFTEHSGLLQLLTQSVDVASLSPLQARTVLCAAAAILAAIMSNTATSALLIPVALEIDPSPATAILVAIATSLGAPFVISTPVNAMVAGEGARARDFLVPGVLLFVAGVALVAATGPSVLGLWGVH